MEIFNVNKKLFFLFEFFFFEKKNVGKDIMISYKFIDFFFKCFKIIFLKNFF